MTAFFLEALGVVVFYCILALKVDITRAFTCIRTEMGEIQKWWHFQTSSLDFLLVQIRSKHFGDIRVLPLF